MSDYEVSDLKSIVKAGAEVITEVAKAEQEQQKTLQSGLDLVKRAGTFLNGVFGPASYELGHVFSDRMRFWRFRNAVDILEKAQTLVEARGLKPDQVRALGFGEGLRLLEVASKEDDPTVQEMWARLMANAVDPQTATKAEKVYVEILNSLSSREAVFLDLLASIDGERGERLMTVGEYNEFVVKMSARAEERWRLFPASERSIAIQNLIRFSMRVRLWSDRSHNGSTQAGNTTARIPLAHGSWYLNRPAGFSVHSSRNKLEERNFFSKPGELDKLAERLLVLRHQLWDMAQVKVEKKPK